MQQVRKSHGLHRASSLAASATRVFARARVTLENFENWETDLEEIW